MSGPKVITYNMSSFKGRLKEFMQMQSRLEQSMDELKMAQIHDNAMNIHFDYSGKIEKLMPDFKKALNSMVFDYEGNISKKTHDSVDKQINTRSTQLEGILKIVQELLSDYQQKQQDYKSYQQYHSFAASSKEAFEKFKTEVKDDTKKNFEKEFPELTNEIQKKYGSIVLEDIKVPFNWGFDKKVYNHKKEIFDKISFRENQLREIRKELFDKVIVLNADHNISNTEQAKKSKVPDGLIRVSEKIGMLIHQCDDKTLVKQYNERFEKLKQSESMNDLFFYQELHDSILEKETSHKNKQQINEIVARLNSSKIEPSLGEEKNELVKKSIILIDNSKVTHQETDSLKHEMNEFFIKNDRMKEEAAIKKKEELFMKTQIIYNFEKMGYTVLDDLEVIDFEKEKDFYLQAPGQENVLNIKFKDDGSFRYVFQIPEKKESLSTDEQKMKLHEMKTTCDDFVNVLNDLKNMGVDIDIKSEKPIELASMITIPESLSTKLNLQKKQTRRKQQIKKLYLE